MWTSTLDLSPNRVVSTKLLGFFWPGAYFSSFAPLQVQNLPRQPLPASNWVRVRNSLAGICGSDLHFIFVDGDFTIAPAALPGHRRIYPGHEVVGEVIEVGDSVQFLRVGDRVALQHGPNCVTAGVQPLCRSCATGNYSLCENGNLPGPQPIGGGWSEEMLLHEQQLFRISPEMSDAQAVLLEPSAVAVHAVLRKLPQPNDCVLIIGAGSIGLLILQAIRALSPKAEVHVLARHAFQVERAASMGAKIIYPQHAYQQVQRATNAQLYEGFAGNKMLLGGYDLIFDTIGTQSTTHDALRWARAGSTIVMVGLSLHQMHIDLTPVWYQEINLIGSLAHGLESWPVGSSQHKSTFEITAELIEQQQMKPEELITQRYLLSEYRTALMDTRHKAQNRVIKVVFDFTRQPPSVVPNVRAASRKRQRSAEPRPSQTSVSPAEPEQTPAAPLSRPLEPVSSSQRASAIWSPPTSTPIEPTATEDAQTMVAPKPKRTRFGSTSHFTSPAEPDVDEDEDRTRVVTPSKHTQVDEDEDKTRVVTPSKHTQFKVAAQFGSLPGFHQGLEKLGIPPQASDEDETTKHVAISPVTSLYGESGLNVDDIQGVLPSSTSDEVLDEAPPFSAPDEAQGEAAFSAPDEAQGEAAFSAPDEAQNEVTFSTSAPADFMEPSYGHFFDTPTDAEGDYAWAQFITPSSLSSGTGEEPPINKPYLDDDEAMPPFLARLAVSKHPSVTLSATPPDNMVAETEAPPETPASTTDGTEETPSLSSLPIDEDNSPALPTDDDATRNMVTASAKRSRSRRKTDDIQTTRRKGTSSQELPLASDNVADSPTSVTNEPPQALQDIGEGSTNQEQTEL